MLGMDIERHIRQCFLDASGQFPVVLVTGARQVGKTTLLKTLREPARRFVSLDDPDIRQLAREDAKLFFQSYPPPLIIDEIQYAPNLLTQIKIIVDDRRSESGLFWLTGSQPFRLMRGVVESLAGRVVVFPLGGISQSEELGGEASPFEVCRAVASTRRFGGVRDVYARILRGSFPDLVSGRVRNRELYYRSYVQTYLERDIRDLTHVSDESRFLDFLRVAAGRTGQLLNLSNMARDVGVSAVTAKSWLSLLETSGLVFLLHPHSRNATARVVKTPKLYFLDTGLACHLSGWKDAEVLQNGAMAGAMLETFVVSEIVKRAWNCGEDPQLWFYRDNAGTEIDVLYERNGVLHPIEVKKTASPTKADYRSFARVAAKGVLLGCGAVACLAEEERPLADAVVVLPIGSI